jgi:hypothetical protein
VMAGRCLSVSVIACVGTSLVAACGGGRSDRSTAGPGRPRASARVGGLSSARTDLRSPDVDGRMDPVSQGTVFACPRAGRVKVFFDPRGTVALVAGGRPLAYGTIGTRAVNRACRSRGRLHRVPTGALGERNQATTLTCAVPRSVRFEVHPIAMAGHEVGSIVAVLMPDLRRILLAAVLEPNGSRIYYSRACHTR